MESIIFSRNISISSSVRWNPVSLKITWVRKDLELTHRKDIPILFSYIFSISSIIGFIDYETNIVI
ncbi:hypothetical protein T190607A01A_10711 [Tenacibaculum sp. 190524A05c]|uniref:Uncharacterized protein n=1 Tax=Tenacibaculum platacis TaxID=3137852 RepID=A0ABM9NTT1_9FLAO